MKNTLPEGLAGKELFKFLKTNEKLLIAEKKAVIKWSDPFAMVGKGTANKAANSGIDETVQTIETKNIINTTYWLDSHDDVHINGLWTKSLQENKLLYLLQEHQMKFDKIITDEVDAYTKQYAWRDLGLELEGKTEALVFDSTIQKDRNTFMFNEYRKGRVKNHSVGMQYVRLQLAINEQDEYFKDEFAVWNKYIDKIANKEQAEDQGFFFAVLEAKCIEGSAVPIGSNIITPTMSVNPKSISTISAPSADTREEPQDEEFDLDKAIKETEIFIF